MEIFIFLIAAHFLCDYPLQGNYMAMAKNRHVLREDDFFNIPKWEEWPWVLSGHAFIHGGAVYLITGLWYLGLAEAIIHWITDDSKCGGKLTYNQDQFIHIACKVTWAIIAAVALGG